MISQISVNSNNVTVKPKKIECVNLGKSIKLDGAKIFGEFKYEPLLLKEGKMFQLIISDEDAEYLRYNLDDSDWDW
jgi:hypothetical protein